VYFSSDQLPDHPERRFEVLFDRKPKWSYDEISPFLVDIAYNYNGIDSLIVKYCRISFDTTTAMKCVTSKLVID
jgi:hypothetical protein